MTYTPKRKLRAMLGIHSILNGLYLIPVEANHCNVFRHNRPASGFYGLMNEEIESLGMMR